ncbi:MAG: polyamine ABC transporter substrate-binding protein, partial [Alphaproteobacteria bacterium]|nr:polyamine ABC transporter substrate-binding protein [Alphaproteobacteria bacterium]
MKTMLRRLALAAVVTVGAGAAHALAEGGGDLVVFDWSGYEDPLLHPAYTAKYNAEPTFSFFGDEDEAFEKMRAGFKADIAHPCSQSV